MKARPCSIPDCPYPRWKNNPQNSKEGWCSHHIPPEHRKGNQMKKSSLKTSKIGTRRKPTGEKALFDSLWEARERVSFISGANLGNEMNVSFMAHVLPKGKYPKFRLYDRNIVFLTAREHHLYDMGTEEQREKHPADWKKLYDLREYLLTIYPNMIDNEEK